MEASRGEPSHKNAHVSFQQNLQTQSDSSSSGVKPRSMSVMSRPESWGLHGSRSAGAFDEPKKSLLWRRIADDKCVSSGEASPVSVQSVASDPEGKSGRTERTNKLLEGLVARFKSPLQHSESTRRATMIDMCVHSACIVDV